MTDLRKAAEMALEAWDKWKGGPFEFEMEALRQALAQPEQESVCAHGVEKTKCGFCKQPEQEPVEYKEECWACGCEECICAQSALGYFAPQKQEPVVWANADDLQNFDMRVRTNCDHYHTVPLYTAPPKKDWVGLTKEEMFEVFEKYSDRPFSLMLATHDKVKEKNT